ncbi:MAG: HAD hydrolase-like protein [Candidatus Hydrogenedentes bacterium]|nr:HAD hydrolase-like protein [Candidatus Hydrogenedentota bacterium]
MNTSKVVMFDFDGVIANSFEIFFSEFTNACEELGFHKLNSKETFLSLFDGNLILSLLKLGFPPWKLKDLFYKFQPRIADANKRVKPFHGIREMLEKISKSYPTYVISSNLSEAVRDFLEREKINGIQEILGADIEPSKVKKIKKIAVKHPNCIPYYIGDTCGDIKEGKEAKAITIAVTWGWHSKDRLEKSKPDYIVESPEKLLEVLEL